MYDPRAMQELVDKHATEMNTCKERYTAHVAGLNEQTGDLQAKNTQALDDLSWFQEGLLTRALTTRMDTEGLLTRSHFVPSRRPDAETATSSPLGCSSGW